VARYLLEVVDFRTNIVTPTRDLGIGPLPQQSPKSAIVTDNSEEKKCATLSNRAIVADLRHGDSKSAGWTGWI